MSRDSDQLKHGEWLAIFERITAHVCHDVGPLLGTGLGRAGVGTTGAGGDRTLEIDRRAEDIVLKELDEMAKGS
jgi:hypothetical protein